MIGWADWQADGMNGLGEGSAKVRSTVSEKASLNTVGLVTWSLLARCLCFDSTLSEKYLQLGGGASLV